MKRWMTPGLMPLLTFLAAVGLAGCGGGGGGDGVGGTPQDPSEAVATSGPFSALSRDTVPSGAGVDVTGRDYFAMAAGNRWVHASRPSAAPGNESTVSVEAQGPADADGFLRLNEVSAPSPQINRYRVTAAGLELAEPLSAVSDAPGVAAALPSVLVVPTPFPPAGQQRALVRQGPLGADADGDGLGDTFRLEFRSTFVGFESTMVLGQSRQSAHFRHVITLIVAGSKDGRHRTVTQSQDAYLVDGLGEVESRTSPTLVDGVSQADGETRTLVRARIGNLHVTADGTVLERHAAIGRPVFDPVRGVYHAAEAAAGAGNQDGTLLTIDPARGVLGSASIPVAGPGPIALSASGDALLVGSQTTGELVRLRLPGLTESGRLALPADPGWGRRFPVDIAASPIDGGLFAVATEKRDGFLPLNAGVFLVRDLAVLPRATPAGASSNKVCFDASGQWLAGLDTENGLPALRGLKVLADGVENTARLDLRDAAPAGYGLGCWAGQVGVAQLVADLPASASARAVPDALACTRLTGSTRLACIDALSMVDLKILDASTFVEVGRVRVAVDLGVSSTSLELVPGAAGQVLVKWGDGFSVVTSPKLK